MRNIQAPIKWFALGFTGAGAALFLYVKNPAGVELIPPCPFRAATGLYCPGCGTLRGLHELLHLRVLQAMHYNILMVSSLPLVAALAGYDVLGRHPSQRSGFVYAYVCTVLIYWVGRNLPWLPFVHWAPSV